MKTVSSSTPPLYSLLKNDVEWNWDLNCNRAFQETKELLTSACILVHFDFKLPISLAGDASAYGIGAVICHRYADGSEKPIAFASSSLSAAKKNYSQLECEASLIFWHQEIPPIYLWTTFYTHY